MRPYVICHMCTSLDGRIIGDRWGKLSGYKHESTLFETTAASFGIGAWLVGTREEEVGLLIAQGMSNKDIAARLFLSVRTVETHVHNLLNKLGVNSRTQIAVWFSEQRPS